MAEQYISYSRQQKALEELSELDSVVEEKKKELKKQEEFNRFKERIKDIGTTKEESQKEVDLWLGLFVPPNNKANVFIILAVLMSVCFASLITIESNIIKLVAIILFIVFSALTITLLFTFAEYEDKEAVQKNRYE